MLLRNGGGINRFCSLVVGSNCKLFEIAKIEWNQYTAEDLKYVATLKTVPNRGHKDLRIIYKGLCDRTISYYSNSVDDEEVVSNAILEFGISCSALFASPDHPLHSTPDLLMNLRLSMDRLGGLNIVGNERLAMNGLRNILDLMR